MTEPRAPGVAVEGWSPRDAPPGTPLSGRTALLERFDPARHAEPLFAAIGGDAHADLWEFIPFGPFASAESLAAPLQALNDSGTWVTYVCRRPGDPALLGMASLMGIQPGHGVAEVGCVIYSPELKRSTEATELQYLLARHVFDDLGYRRYEWKCDARNAASRAAAARLGFTFEGVFRNHMVVRGLNRDTAWFSMTDAEWPAIRAGFEAWLAPTSFDGEGRPRRSLATLRAEHASS